jgi:hypothetical protein
MPQPKKYQLFTYERLTQQKPDTEKIAGIAITVTTGSIPSAGTDANVRLLIGANRFDMDTAGYNDFEKGDTDTYYFKTDMTLGQLRKSYIELSHDNSGNKPGWYVSNFVLQAQFPNTAFMALYKRWGNIGWLAKDEPPYHTTAVELQHGEQI